MQVTSPRSMPDKLRAMVELAKQKLNAASLSKMDIYKICLVLSKAIDSTLASSQVPSATQDLIHVVKQLSVHKDAQEVRSGLLVLLLSFKNAVHVGWFSNNQDAAELANMTNEMLKLYRGPGEGHTIFSSTYSEPSASSDAEACVEAALKRFYPWLKRRETLLCVDVKAGYAALVCDFCVSSKHRLAENESVRLFAVRKDALETPVCLVTPAQVSFLMNGYPVEKRTVGAIDTGPQVPSVCTRLVRTGGNVLQIFGDFQAPYTIIVAIATAIKYRNEKLPVLEPQPPAHIDDDLMEGPSRVSLCCPISRKRINVPVKGRACKHLQCFDYDNFLEINKKRPSWRCPYCNVLVTSGDLRIDKKMAEILWKLETTLVYDVTIFNDGSWEAIDPTNHDLDISAEDLIELPDDVGAGDEATTSIPYVIDLEDEKPDIGLVSTNAGVFSSSGDARNYGVAARSHDVRAPPMDPAVRRASQLATGSPRTRLPASAVSPHYLAQPASSRERPQQQPIASLPANLSRLQEQQPVGLSSLQDQISRLQEQQTAALSRLSEQQQPVILPRFQQEQQQSSVRSQQPVILCRSEPQPVTLSRLSESPSALPRLQEQQQQQQQQPVVMYSGYQGRDALPGWMLSTQLQQQPQQQLLQQQPQQQLLQQQPQQQLLQQQQPSYHAFYDPQFWQQVPFPSQLNTGSVRYVADQARIQNFPPPSNS